MVDGEVMFNCPLEHVKLSDVGGHQAVGFKNKRRDLSKRLMGADGECHMGLCELRIF